MRRRSLGTGLATFVLLLVAALPTRAQMQACAGLQTQMAMNECAAREYKKHDAAMNDVYQRLLARITDAQQKAMLVDAERAWLAYRDKFCAFQSSGTLGGTIHSMIEADCLDEKTNVHAAELRRQLDCREGDPSCVH
jgi:uncharacterized protein YecT (DUF1311 family)